MLGIFAGSAATATVIEWFTSGVLFGISIYGTAKKAGK